MSIELMRAAWQVELPGTCEKLVLLALADYANDEGRAWPSVPTLARKCSRHERAVRAALHRLIKAGHATREERLGKTPIYVVHPTMTPPQNAPLPKMSGGTKMGSPTPPQNGQGTPLHKREGTPPQNGEPIHQEPPINPHLEPAAVGGAFPAWLPAESWASFIDMRKRAKKPLEGRAITLALSTLEKLRADGHDVGQVIDQSVLNGWRGFFPVKQPDAARTPSRQGKWEMPIGC